MRSRTLLQSVVAALGVALLLVLAPDESRADSPASECNINPNMECGRLVIPDFICIEVAGQLECDDLDLPFFGELSPT